MKKLTTAFAIVIALAMILFSLVATALSQPRDSLILAGIRHATAKRAARLRGCLNGSIDQSDPAKRLTFARHDLRLALEKYRRAGFKHVHVGVFDRIAVYKSNHPRPAADCVTVAFDGLGRVAEITFDRERDLGQLGNHH